jgi:thiol-disulfide isomerase/thioredoxin
MAKGNEPDCHCFGQIHSEPVGTKALVRNIIFSLLALFLVAQGRDGQGYSLAEGGSNTMQLLLMFLVAVLLGAALFYLKKVLDGQTEILRRMELLEVLSREGAPLERHNAGSPHDGLPIGAPFPDFDLPSASGKRITLDALRDNGMPSVFFFVSATCDPCKALLPEIERWEAELGDRINFVLFSSGTAEENASKFGVFSSDVILQEKRELADSVYARWTPTAIFVRADGTVGSHPAAGDIAIRELIERLRTGDAQASNVFFAGEKTYSGKMPMIGTAVPKFRLTDTDGNTIEERAFQGKRTLAVFWSPTCPHCKAMMDDLKSWDQSRNGSDLNLIVFSDGEKSDHESLGLNAPVVIDTGYETAEKLGMFGTPSAVVVDESGTIASETAVGASNIWALIGRRP